MGGTGSFLRSMHCPTQRAPDGWDSARFWAFTELRQFSVSRLFSPQPPVTQAIVQPRKIQCFTRTHEEETDMKRVTGIGGIFFNSPDPVTLRAWYKEHL